MPGTKVNISRIRQQPSGDIARIGLQDTRVDFGIEGAGFSHVIIASPNPTPDEIKAAISAAVNNLHPSEGTQLEV